jgi:hypothetical protein
MGDHYGDNPELDKLDYIGGNLIDIETEQKKTNELLGQILEELRKPNHRPIGTGFIAQFPNSAAAIAPTGFSNQTQEHIWCSCGKIYPKGEEHEH